MTSRHLTPIELAAEAVHLEWSDSAPPWVMTADATATAAAMAGSHRVALGADAIRAIGIDNLSSREPAWWPLLPLAEVGEVLAVTDLVTSGSLGSLSEVEVTVGHGRPPWDPEPTEPYAASPFEAAVWGLHLIEKILRIEVQIDRWLRYPGGPASLVGTFDRDQRVSGRLRVLPAQLVPNQSFTATFWFADGHVMVRHPLSVGRIAVWDGRRLELRSSNGGQLGPSAGNDAWPAQHLQRVLRWAKGELDAPADLRSAQANAIAVVTRVADHWPEDTDTSNVPAPPSTGPSTTK